MVRDGVQQVRTSRVFDTLALYMEAYGFQRDVHASDITNVLDIEPIRGGHHVGPYTGRFNHYQQRRGSDLRIVPGQLPNSYRLIRIAL